MFTHTHSYTLCKPEYKTTPFPVSHVEKKTLKIKKNNKNIEKAYTATNITASLEWRVTKNRAIACLIVPIRQEITRP